MVLGVLAFGNLVASIAALIDAYKDSYKKPERVSPEVFYRFLDSDRNGRISKAEFRSYMLLREGKAGCKRVQGFWDMSPARSPKICSRRLTPCLSALTLGQSNRCVAEACSKHV